MVAHDGPVESISAVTLATARMADAVTFFEKLGFERLYGGPGDGFTSYQVGSGYLNLERVDDWRPPEQVWGRVIFYVTDVDEMYERARAAGVVPLAAPADAPWGERYFHVRSPDGHELSFARPL